MFNVSNTLTWTIKAVDKFTPIMANATKRGLSMVASFAVSAAKYGVTIARGLASGITSGITHAVNIGRRLFGGLMGGLKSLFNPWTLLAGGGVIYSLDKILNRIDNIGDAIGGFQQTLGVSETQAKDWADQLNKATGGLMNIAQSTQLSNQLLQLKLYPAEIAKIFQFARIQSEVYGRDFQGVVGGIASSLASGRIMGLKELGLMMEDDSMGNESVDKRRVAILDAMQEVIGKLGDKVGSQVDSWTKLRNTVGSFIDKILYAASKTSWFSNLMDSFDKVGSILGGKDIDPTKLEGFFSSLGKMAKTTINWVLDSIRQSDWIQGIWGFFKKIGAAISYTWNNILKPIFEKVSSYFGETNETKANRIIGRYGARIIQKYGVTPESLKTKNADELEKYAKELEEDAFEEQYGHKPTSIQDIANAGLNVKNSALSMISSNGKSTPLAGRPDSVDYHGILQRWFSMIGEQGEYYYPSHLKRAMEYSSKANNLLSGGDFNQAVMYARKIIASKDIPHEEKMKQQRELTRYVRNYTKGTSQQRSDAIENVGRFTQLKGVNSVSIQSVEKSIKTISSSVDKFTGTVVNGIKEIAQRFEKANNAAHKSLAMTGGH